MKKDIPKETTSPCKDCFRVNNFSFSGCAKDCERILGHIKRILSQKNCSPCKNFRCDIPGAKSKGREVCLKCRLPQIYADQLGMGPKSSMGKPRTPFITEWDIRHGRTRY